MSSAFESVLSQEPNSRLSRRIAEGNLDAIRRLLVEQPELLHQPQHEGNWLNVAASSSTPAVIHFFVAQGQALDAPNVLNKPTLWWALERGDNFEAVKTLLELGASPNSQYTRRFPLHLPVLNPNKRESTRLIKELIDHGADPNVFNSQMRTPLGLAARWGNPEDVELLLLAGADPFLHADDARNAKTEALEANRVELAEYIQSFSDAWKARILISDVADATDQDVRGVRPL